MAVCRVCGCRIIGKDDMCSDCREAQERLRQEQEQRNAPKAKSVMTLSSVVQQETPAEEAPAQETAPAPSEDTAQQSPSKKKSKKDKNQAEIDKYKPPFGSPYEHVGLFGSFLLILMFFIPIIMPSFFGYQLMYGGYFFELRGTLAIIAMLALPAICLITIIAWACGASRNIMRKRLSRAYLLFFLFFLGVMAAVFFIGAAWHNNIPIKEFARLFKEMIQNGFGPFD